MSFRLVMRIFGGVARPALLMLALAAPSCSQICTFTVTPDTASFTSSGGNNQIAISASSQTCLRTATSNAMWITISSGSSRTGDGSVGYSVAANPFFVDRTGTLTVAGKAFTVTQSATACTFSVSPTSFNVPETGGIGSLNITTANNTCPWALTSGNPDWLSITPPVSGTGNGNAYFSTKPNALNTPRTGTITVNMAPSPLFPWNSAVSCAPVLTTLRQILGSQQNSLGGALQSGGWLYTIPAKDALAPPCKSAGGGTFVQINNLLVASKTQVIYSDGDYAFNLIDDNDPDPNVYMRTIHVEDSATFQQAGIGPPLTITPGLATTLVAGQRIDIQGFVFWDTGHTTDAWHSHSGWEIHPLASWRINPASPPVSTLLPVPVNLSYGHNATITAISGNVVTVKADNGNTYTANVTPSAILYNSQGAPVIKLSDLQVSDRVNVVGKVGVNTIELGHIKNFALRHELTGTITMNTPSQVNIESSGTIYTASITSATAFYDEKGVSIPRSAMTVGDRVLAYGLIRGTSITLKFIKDFSKP